MKIPDNRIGSVFAVLGILIFLSPVTDILPAVVAQNRPSPDAREVYLSRKSQLDFLLEQTQPADSLPFFLKKEAEYFASGKDWLTALNLIDQAINICRPAKSDSGRSESVLPAFAGGDNGSSVLEAQPGNWQWAVEFGSDYSRQEYEMNFIESDSVVLEQLNNPFAGIRISRSGVLLNRSYRTYNYLRGDRELLQAGADFNLESADFNRYWRLEAQSSLFWLHRDNRGSFWENQFLGSWNFPVSPKNSLALNSQLRYKLHFPSDSAYGDISSGEAGAAFRRYLGLLSWVQIGIRPSFYREAQDLGLRYTQLESRLDLEHRRDFNKYLRLQASYYLRNFQSRQTTGEYKNRYHSLHPTLDAEYPVIHPFGLANRVEWESRWYRNPDLSYSDFYFTSLSSEIKYYFGDFNSIGAGYVYELEHHFTHNSEDRALVEQENYDAKGFVLSVDLMNFSGFLLSIYYQYTLRIYHNAGEIDLLGYYSNRRIHTVQGIGYVPLTRRWQLQFFANYDNDRDREREANDNFSTIFNLGLIYKF